MTGSAIYPIKDAWLDTIAIRGIRAQRLGVTIRIYSPAHTARAGLHDPGEHRVVRLDVERPEPGRRPPARRNVPRRPDPGRPVDGSGAREVVGGVAGGALDEADDLEDGHAHRGARTEELPVQLGRGGRCRPPRHPPRALVLAGASGAWPAVGYEFTLPAASTYRQVRFEVLGSASASTAAVGLHRWSNGAAWGQVYRADFARTAVVPSTVSRGRPRGDEPGAVRDRDAAGPRLRGRRRQARRPLPSRPDRRPPRGRLRDPALGSLRCGRR